MFEKYMTWRNFDNASGRQVCHVAPTHLIAHEKSASSDTAHIVCISHRSLIAVYRYETYPFLRHDIQITRANEAIPEKTFHTILFYSIIVLNSEYLFEPAFGGRPMSFRIDSANKTFSYSSVVTSSCLR